MGLTYWNRRTIHKSTVYRTFLEYVLQSYTYVNYYHGNNKMCHCDLFIDCFIGFCSRDLCKLHLHSSGDGLLFKNVGSGTVNRALRDYYH